MKPPFTSGDVARTLGLSIRRVQQLEDVGVLRAIRTKGGYRIFDADHVERVRQDREQAKQGHD